MTNAERTERIAQVVRDSVRAQQLSVNSLALATGVHRSTLVRRLNGKSPFTTEELDIVAGALGTTLAAVVTAADELAAA